jgi:hypothetical protein
MGVLDVRVGYHLSCFNGRLMIPMLTSSEVARVAAAMGMTVLAYTASPRLTPESRRDNRYILPGTGDPDGTLPASWHHGSDKASLHAFLSLDLDHIVISLPLTPQTTKLLGAEEFSVLSSHCTRPGSKPHLTNILQTTPCGIHPTSRSHRILARLALNM